MDRAERDTDDLCSGGAGAQYLTPTKAFSKKRMTAGAAVVGAVHSSPEASMGHSKGEVICDGWTQEQVSNVEVQESIGSRHSHCLDRESMTTPLECTRPHQVSAVAELAAFCKQACEETKMEMQPQHEGSVLNSTGDSADHEVHVCGSHRSSRQSSSDRLLHLGAGNKYLRGALKKIGCHLGLGREQTA